MEPLLAGDVGGTHITLAILHEENGRYRKDLARTYPSPELQSFSELTSEFLAQAQNAGLTPRRACFGVPAPLDADRSAARLTNLRCDLSVWELFRDTSLTAIAFLNDFEAIGFGVDFLDVGNRLQLVQLPQPDGSLPAAQPKAVKGILGAGTGLGMSILVYQESKQTYVPLPSEGGHVDFPAQDEDAILVLEYLRERVNNSPENPVECEYAVSGPGLHNIYAALESSMKFDHRPEVRKKLESLSDLDRPAAIHAYYRQDPLCNKAVGLFVRFYARTAKNLALMTLPYGGVYLAGGIAPKILDILQEGTFMEEFGRMDRPAYCRILARIPVYVVMDYHVSLYGMARVAAHFMKEFGHFKA
ncbi:MAG: glucokinase [Acidobacteria bacterium]|nr:glucokinase [Acidobacteriota bacterium]